MYRRGTTGPLACTACAFSRLLHLPALGYSTDTIIVAWTGHRPDLFESPAAAEVAVKTLAGELVEHPAPSVRFVVGGQRGVDTWAADAAIELGASLTLILPLPSAEFARDWPEDDRQALELTLSRATEIRVVAADPSPEPRASAASPLGQARSTAADRARAFTERNRLLVANADLLVAVWTGLPGGGTAETIAFARARRTPLRELLLPPSPGAHLAGGRGM